MAIAATIDLERMIDEQKLGRFNLLLLMWSFLVMMTDGLDGASLSYAAPAMIKAWGIDRAALGPVFGAGLFAGLFGAPLFGFIADRYGRKRAIILGACWFGAFTLATAWSQSSGNLLALRFLAGLGIAGAYPSAIALNAEFAPRRFRATLVITMFSGVTFGAGVTGPIAALVLPRFGWPVLFMVTGVLPLVMAACLAVVLPESIKFLALKPHRRAELMRVLKRFRPGLAVAPDAVFAVAGGRAGERPSPKLLFAGPLRWLTPLLWAAFILNIMVLYLISSWMPTMLAGLGIPIARASLAASLLQFGGVLGGLCLMRPQDRYGMMPIALMFALSVAAIAALGVPWGSETMLFAVIFAAGFCVYGLQFGINAAASMIYPTVIRSNGVGWAFAISRLGAFAGPVIGGALIAWKLSFATFFLIAAIPQVAGTVVAIVLARRFRAAMADAA